MKRFLSMILCLALLLSAAACGGQTSGGGWSPAPDGQATGGGGGWPPAPDGQATGSGGGWFPSSDPVLISEPMAGNPLSYTVTGGSVYVQDMRDYMGAIMTVKAPGDSSKEYLVFSFEGNRANEDDIRTFVETICSGSYNLKLVDTYRQEYKGGDVFGSFAINYTGTGRVDSTGKANFSNVECNLSVWYTIERDKLKGQFGVPSTMDVVDLGLRRGGNNDDLSLAGPSAMAGLYRMPDGSYQTTDGRLSTAPGYATVLRDGQRYSVEASYVRDKDGGSRERIWVRDFYRDETIYFNTPAGRLMTGDVFVLRDLIFDKNRSYSSAKEFDSYNYSVPFFGLGHNGDFIYPRYGSGNRFDELTVRVMYWEPNTAAVYYIYAELSTAPYTVEALCAVSLARSEGFSGGDDERLMYAGQSIELSSPREFMPNYELFTWEIVEGAGVVELSGTNTGTCTVKALRTGTAVVRVSYNYGIDEPDVLTGFMRNADHVTTVDYVIFVQ